MSFLKLESITHCYSKKKQSIAALESIDFILKEEESIALCGPSGSGKSTLLFIMGGLRSPTEGKIYFQNRDLYALSDKEASHFRNVTMGFVFQSFFLQPYLTVIENVMLPLLIRGEKENSARIKAQSILERVSLEKRIHHLPQEISGGEAQRVSIARALIGHPKIILADEPTGNLDDQTCESVISVIRDIARENKIALLIATHDIHIASAMDRIIHIQEGRLISK